MLKSIVGLLLAFVIGALCRWIDIPVPSPNKILGALLVLATTLGYVCADKYWVRDSSSPTEVSDQTSYQEKT